MVAAKIAATIAPTGCGDDRPVYTPYNCYLDVDQVRSAITNLRSLVSAAFI